MPPRRAVTGRSQNPRERFAQELRLLRTQRGESLRQLADVLGWDYSHLGKMEQGETIGGPEVAEALDHHYGTPELVLAMWELAAADPSQFYEQYRQYMTLEAEAVSFWHFAVSVIHGLLQTEAYARAVLTAGGVKGEELTQQVNARISRRKLLDGDTAAPFRTIMSETALRSAPCDVSAWQEQLEHLAEMIQRPNITVQVLPLRAGLHSLDGTDVMFLRLSDGRTVAYIENVHRGELIQESTAVERLQRRYDAVRDLALSPAESFDFITQLLEEVSCGPST